MSQILFWLIAALVCVAVFWGLKTRVKKKRNPDDLNVLFQNRKHKSVSLEDRHIEPSIGTLSDKDVSHAEPAISMLESTDEYATSRSALASGQNDDDGGYESSETPSTPIAEQDVPELMSLLLVARDDHPFAGYELLQSLLSLGLRYGQMQIFHRHEEISGAGEILFSLASATEPGMFDLSNIGEYSSPALTLFMQLSLVEDGVSVFNLMLEAARQLAEDLDAVIYLNHNTVLTDEHIKQLRMQARCYQNANLHVTT